MQPRPLLMATLSTIRSRYALPVVHDVVAEENLREARAVRLHVRVAAIEIHGGLAAEDQAAGHATEHGGADVGAARIDADRLARNAGGEERLGHPVRRPGLLRAGLEDEADLHRNDRQPQRVHARRVGRQHEAEHRGSAPDS